MSNCEQQLEMTNRHCARAPAAAEQKNIEVLTSVVPGSRINCAGEALTAISVRRSTSKSAKGAGIAVNNPDMPGVIPATVVGDSPLPCRGCTRNCSRYGRCNHTPWRSADLSRKRTSQHIDSTGCATLINACSVA